MHPSLPFFTIVGILLCSLFNNCYAFQQPTTLAPQEDQTYQALKKKWKAAEALVYEGDYDGAINAYRKVQDECATIGLKGNIETLYGELYQDIYTIYVIRDDYEFEDKLNGLQQVKPTEDDSKFLSLYFGGLAYLYIFYGEVDSMTKYYDLADKLFNEHQQYKAQANLNSALSLEMVFAEELSTAKTFVDKAEAILTSKLLPKGIDVPSIYRNKCIIYIELGENEIAIEAALKDIAHLKADSFTLDVHLAGAYSRLATMYSYQDDYIHALDYYNKALDINLSSDNPSAEDLGNLYSNIGATYGSLHNKVKAKNYYFRAIESLNQTDALTEATAQDYINTFFYLASSYLEDGQIDSVEYFTLKAKAYQKEFPYRTVFTKTYLAEVYLSRKEYEEAKSELNLALQEGLEIYGDKHEFISSVYIDFAKIMVQENKLRDALLYCQKGLIALSLDFSDTKGASNPELQNVLSKGNLLPVLTRKIAILEKLEQEGKHSFNKDAIYETAKLATETLEVLSRGFKNKASKHHWLNKSAIPFFEDAIQIAVNTYEKTNDETFLNEAFQLSEKSKSMLMADAMQEANASNFGGVPDSLIHQSKTLQKALNKAEKKRFDAKMRGELTSEKIQDSLIFNYKHDLAELKHTFETKYPKYYELKYTTQIANIKDIQAVLDDKTTFIEYFEGRLNIYVFSISKTTANVKKVAKKDDYNQRSFLFQSSLMNIKDAINKPTKTYNRFIKESHYFYTTLLESSLNKTSNRLIIVPDGKLGYLPFEVLLTSPCEMIGQGKEKPNFATLPYLVKDYIISYNYSGTLLIGQQASQKNIINGNILALAPSYANKTTPEWRGERETNLREHLSELPGAAKEVSKLQELFSGKFFIGADANESVFKKNAEQYGILHLAMHGLVDKNTPEYSGLAMTEDNSKEEDNFLYAYEIKQMNLNAGLVVLSACETGIGKYQRGEGVVSIGRGFMYAGAPALLMTLWMLNDQSGAIIIEQFYKNMSNGMPKDEAIQKAKLYYLNNVDSEYAHPFMWAAFVQVGDYSPISISSPKPWLWYGAGTIGVLVLLLVGIKRRRAS